MAFADSVLKMKQDFENRFDQLLVSVDKDEMVDPAEEMRCERVALDADFGASPFFMNDLENPYGEKGFSPESIFIYCHNDEEVFAKAVSCGAGAIPESISSLENDLRCALAFFASEKKGSDAIASDYCRNIAAPVENISDRNLAGAFNILFLSGLDKSVRSDMTCLDKSWFTSENGYVPGSQAFADFVSAFRAYEKLGATSRKDALIRSLYGSLKAYTDYAEKHRMTMGALSLFVAHVRQNFHHAHNSGQAKGFSFIDWNMDKTTFSGNYDGNATHIMLLHECGQDENPVEVVKNETVRMAEWFNDEVYRVYVSPKSDPSEILFDEVFFRSDIENGLALSRINDAMDMRETQRMVM